MKTMPQPCVALAPAPVAGGTTDHPVDGPERIARKARSRSGRIAQPIEAFTTQKTQSEVIILEP